MNKLLYCITVLSVSLISSTFCFESNGNNEFLKEDVVVVTTQSGLSFERQVTSPYTVYEIQGTIDLKGESVIIPVGSELVGGRNAVISNGKLTMKSGCRISNCSFTNVQILISDAEHVRIKDCTFEGLFTAKVLRSQQYMNAAIYCSKSRDTEFDHITISKYQWGIAVFDSFRIVVDNIVYTGVLKNSINFSESIQNANYHDAVHLSNTHFSRVCNVAAYNCGACVLLGRTSKSNVIEGCKGDVLWDNGVYISSGNNNIVQNCVFNNVRGTGVKARGNCNIIANNTVSDVGVGFAITGNGAAIGEDEYGKEYNGYGSMISGNTVINAYNCGITVGEQDGLPPYRFSVTNNNIVNGPTENPSISVFCNGASIVGNNVFCPNAFGIVVSQKPNAVSGGYMISENNVSCKRRGIVIQKCKDSMITNNVVNSDLQGIVVFATENSSFITNKLQGNGKYSVSGHIKGTSNYYKTLGAEDALVPSSHIIVDK